MICYGFRSFNRLYRYAIRSDNRLGDSRPALQLPPMPNATPLPGQPVRGSATGRPVMALLDLLGRRGALRLLWELRDGRGQTFRSLQAVTDGMSPSVLNGRLKELREARVIELTAGAGYALTPSGAELLKRLKPLGQWADEWAADNPPFSAQP
jgi:DNA-binding HxlR family transcriptional regulator